MSDFLLSQILVGFACLLDMISFQFKKRESVLLCFLASIVLISAHFWLLDQKTAAAMGLVGMGRYLVSIFWTLPVLRYVFLLAAVLATFLTYSGWLSLLALVASGVNTIGAFSPRDQYMRLWVLAGTVLWLTHNIFVQTPLGILIEFLFLSSNILGYYRFYIRPKGFETKEI